MGDHDERESGSTGLTFSNPKIQHLRRLVGRRGARDEASVVVVEGAALVEQAVAAGWRVESQFVAPGSEPVDCGSAVFHVAPNVIERVASTHSPRPLIAVVQRRQHPLPAGATFIVGCHQLADPGNAGTIIRGAEAAGADGVLFTPGSVDPFAPKVVRASAGSVFRIPVIVAELGQLRAMGLSVMGSSSHRGSTYSEVDLRQPVALVVGNEAHGLPDDAPVDGWLTIPHSGPVESLNAAMAATLLVFEVARQRRSG